MPRITDSPALPLPLQPTDRLYVERGGSGPFEVPLSEIGNLLDAAPADHTHSLESLGAAAGSHTHTANQVAGLGPVATMTLAEAQAAVSEYGARTLPSLTWPRQLPRQAASPPTITVGGANAATAISGAVQHKADKPGAFNYFGGPISRPRAFPENQGLALGYYPYKTTNSFVSVEFTLNLTDATGRFEYIVKGNGGRSRVLVKNDAGVYEYQSVSGTTIANDGNVYKILVTLGTAGVYDIRIETYLTFFLGILIPPASTVTATPRRAKRVIVIGNSWVEPTVVDPGAIIGGFGWPQMLGYITGYEFWSAGSGQTDYIAPGSGGRVKLRDRLAQDILIHDADEFWFVGGQNDLAFGSDASYTNVRTELELCIAATKSAKPSAKIRVMSPFPVSGPQYYNSGLLPLNDAIRLGAQNAGVEFYDLLDLGKTIWEDAGWETTAIAASTGTTLQLADVPQWYKGGSLPIATGDLWIALWSSSTNRVIRRCSGDVTTVPGGYQVAMDLAATVSAGTRVTLGSPGMFSGNGRVGATNGTGDADVMIGTDGSHATFAGHRQVALTVAGLISQ